MEPLIANLTPNGLKLRIEEALKKDSSLVTESGDLNYTKIRDMAQKLDPHLAELLMTEESCVTAFFKKIGKSKNYIFDSKRFADFLEQNTSNNSDSKFLGKKIGLYYGDELLTDRGEVVLNFPYKDCVLEGGQKTEDGEDVVFTKDSKTGEIKESTEKRREIFYNEILAADEITSLFEPKAFCNVKRYEMPKQVRHDRHSAAASRHDTDSQHNTASRSVEARHSGETSHLDESCHPEHVSGSVCTHFNRDKAGMITDNLIIKGNNLLALHSLYKEFAGRVKLIYIDPPYNTGSDSFAYNDNYNHSTWLTFMKNRLEIARELLREDGAIFVQIDHHELGYLMVLLDEVFGVENKVQVISVKAASVSGFKAVNPGPIDVTEYILFYTKSKHSFEFKKSYVEMGYNRNYNKYLETHNSENVNDWEFISIKDKVLSSVNKSEKELKKQFGDAYQFVIEQMIAQFAFEHADNIISIRDLHKPTPKMKELQDKSRVNRDKIFTYEKANGEKTYLINGGAIAFYSAKIHELDGKKCVTELLSDFWDDISWAGIASEGGIKLKNAKKPEKLLKRIIEMSTESGDLVLDYHLGSGTTAAVAHKMHRQYIGIEQLDYGKNDSVVRLQNVINGDQSGISKSVGWNPQNAEEAGSFVYMELAAFNETALKEISACKNYEELCALFKPLCQKYFLYYNVHLKDFGEKIITDESFKTLSLKKQKEMFCRMLDLNELYINKSEMEDAQFGLSENDIAATKDFYGEK